jgi:BMFP domain-containing protein YqiC
MSSTLFARGVTTQVGQRRRHEILEKNIADLQAALTSMKDLPNQVRVLEARNATLERRITALETAQASAPPESPSA